MFKAKKLVPEEASKAINAKLEERKRQPAGGGISFDKRLTEMLREVIAKGIEKAARAREKDDQ